MQNTSVSQNLDFQMKHFLIFYILPFSKNVFHIIFDIFENLVDILRQHTGIWCWLQRYILMDLDFQKGLNLKIPSITMCNTGWNQSHKVKRDTLIILFKKISFKVTILTLWPWLERATSYFSFALFELLGNKFVQKFYASFFSLLT